MTQTDDKTYAAPRAIHPGEILEEWLDEAGLTAAELAARVALSEKAVSQIMNGHAPLTPDSAVRLERVTKIPATTWNSFQRHYDERVSRVRLRERLGNQVEFLDQFPVSFLRKHGFVRATARDKVTQLEELLSFFNVADPEAWGRVWHDPKVAFRQSLAFEPNAGAVATWLRLGELSAAEIETVKFDAGKLRAALPDIRTLTLGDMGGAAKAIQQMCADAGVAVAYVPEVPGSRCSGATRWLSSDKALVQLSLRYKTDDQLFFSLFHELGHVLLHGKRAAFIDHNGEVTDPDNAAAEAEANKFAARWLIPAEFEDELPGLKTISGIQEFSTRIGIAPGVVVGRLQREGVIGYNIGHGLKRRLRFASDDK